ncbi:Metal-binding domain-containing protein [Trypanosoma cruzi cruzi]|nr:Metal-binding domain-containing protein [Trypanosoma cruzi cruzi]
MDDKTLQCTLEVHSGDGECTRRTFTVKHLPRTLREVVELLKAQDLRLQRGNFEFSVICGESSSPQQLLADRDVNNLFSSFASERLLFKVTLQERVGGLVSSMLADDSLVHLRIYHRGNDLVTEKRFIPPRRGVREALVIAVRDAIQQPPPASVGMQLYAIVGDMCDQTALKDEDAINTFLRSCMVTRSVCRLTYQFDNEGVINEADAFIQTKKLGVNNAQLPPSDPIQANSATPQMPKRNDGDDVLCEKPSRAEDESDAPCEKPSRVEDESDAPCEKPSRVEDESDAPCEKPSRAEDESNAPREKPSRVEDESDAQASSVVPVNDVNSALVSKSSSHNGSAASEPLTQMDAVSDPPETAVSAARSASPLRELAKNGRQLLDGAGHLKQNDGDPPAVTLTAKYEEAPRPIMLVAEEKVPTVAASGRCHAMDAKIKKEKLRIEIECKFGDSTVVFPFSWRRDSASVLQSLREACLIALEVPRGENVNLYDRKGTVLHTEEDTCKRLESILLSGCTRIGLVLWSGHPCTSGLPLQCCVSWGTQQIVMVCTVEREMALMDLRRAILDEYGMDYRNIDGLHLFLSNGEMEAESELTSSRAYEQLKAASLHEELVNIRVSIRDGPSLCMSMERNLPLKTAAFVEEALLLLGDQPHSNDVLKIFEECSGKTGALEKDAKDFIALVIVMLSEPRILTRERLTSFLLKTAAPCSEEGVLEVLNRCAAIAQLRMVRRPFDVLKRFFRRLYGVIQIPEGAKGIPLTMVTRQLAQAGLSDAKGLLRRDRTILAELQEKDYTELFLRLYFTDAKMITRAVVAARLSGIGKIRSRRVMTSRGKEMLREDFMHEIRHAFDGIRSTDVLKFLRSQEPHPEPNFRCLLSVMGSLLATHPVQHPDHWFVERFRGKVADALDVKLRTFEDSVVSTPQLYRLCWDVLKPDMHHLLLLPESPVASAFACWAFFAVQLICVNRHLEFPPVPLVDLQKFSLVGLPISPVEIARDDALNVVSPAAAASGGAAAALPFRTNKPRIKYKYSYLCHGLCRDVRVERPLK